MSAQPRLSQSNNDHLVVVKVVVLAVQVIKALHGLEVDGVAQHAADTTETPHKLKNKQLFYYTNYSF